MFNLDDFLPYKLSILSQAISGLVAETYETKFGLTMNQWRCLVVIQAHQPVTAKSISAYTLLDKMTISRAVKILEKRKLVKTKPSGQDARSRLLSLTNTGQKIYDEVIPIAQDYESQLLETLTSVQKTALEKIIGNLMHGVRDLKK